MIDLLASLALTLAASAPIEAAEAALLRPRSRRSAARPRRSRSGGGAAALVGATYYPNCAAARAAGAAPVKRGDPGYNGRLDRDGDGVGCE